MKSTVWAIGDQGFGTYSVGPSFKLSKTDAPANHYLVPGFVDIHIHGAFGIDFMTASRSQMQELCEKLALVGYEKFLPTTITSGAHEVSRALSNLPDHPLIGGFHLEGPFISPEFPGAQPVDYILEVGAEPSYWNLILNDSRLKVVTLAPELPGALELISHLAKHNAVASMGHSASTYSQAVAGIEAGARHLTHTYNAMTGLHHREPGLVGAGLITDSVYCEVIYDRLHVSKPAMEVVLRCKGMDKVIAVSDSSAATGLPDGTQFEMWGHNVVKKDGSVRIAESGALAGSSVTLNDCFKNLAEDFGAEVAIRACCINPRISLGWNDDPRVWLVLDSKFDIVEILSAPSDITATN